MVQQFKQQWMMLPDDVKLLIDMGLYTEEEILTKYASQGNLERRYILTRPVVKN